MKFNPVSILLAVVIVWAASPALTFADDSFSQLVVADDLSPEQRVTKKKELAESALVNAIEKARGMQASLEALEFAEESIELGLKDKYLAEVAGYITYYEEQAGALQELYALEAIDMLIENIIAYREETYAPSAREVLEFVLVFSYSPSVLETARERFEHIKSDVERLEALELIETGQFTETLEQSQAALDEIAVLQIQAQALIVEGASASSTDVVALPETATTTEVGAIPVEPAATTTAATTTAATTTAATTTAALEVQPELTKVTAAGLAESSLNKVKDLYDVFMATGAKVKELIGI